MIVTLWAAMIVGMALWGYGLFVTGTPHSSTGSRTHRGGSLTTCRTWSRSLALCSSASGVLRLTGRANAKGHPHHLGRRWTRPKTVLMRNKATPNTERARDRYSASAVASDHKALAPSNKRRPPAVAKPDLASPRGSGTSPHLGVWKPGTNRVSL